MAVSELEDAWTAVHTATPPGSYVGQPTWHVERRESVMYAFDTTERLSKGDCRSREWTAHPTEVGVVAEMARCLREIVARRVPK